MLDTTTFLKAIREAYRFPSERGDLTFEDLWKLPLQSTRGRFSLDCIAQDLHAASQQNAGVSFVTNSTSPEAALALAKLDIVKFVIATKMEENKAKLEREARAQQRRNLTELLANKEAQALQALTVEEIRAQLDKLDD